ELAAQRRQPGREVHDEGVELLERRAGGEESAAQFAGQLFRRGEAIGVLHEPSHTGRMGLVIGGVDVGQGAGRAHDAAGVAARAGRNSSWRAAKPLKAWLPSDSSPCPAAAANGADTRIRSSRSRHSDSMRAARLTAGPITV